MEQFGIGVVTGLYGISGIPNAIIVDSRQVFDAIKRGAEKITTSREGSAGFRSMAVRQGDVDIVVVQAPSYPPAIVEAVSELYVFGVRNIVSISRGYRFSKRVPPSGVLVAVGSIPRDSLSVSIAGSGVPLLASQKLASAYRSMVELRFSDFDWIYGFTVTVESPMLRWCTQPLRDLAGKRGVYAVDSLTAALYAAQYEFQNLETLSLLTLRRNLQLMGGPVASSSEYSEIEEREVREEAILYMTAVELFKALSRTSMK